MGQIGLPAGGEVGGHPRHLFSLSVSHHFVLYDWGKILMIICVNLLIYACKNVISRICVGTSGYLLDEHLG